MSLAAWRGILIPFLGTSLGASSVFFLGKSPHPLIQRGSDRLRRRRDGRSVCLESAHSRHGAGRPHGALGRLPGRRGILARYSLFASAGSNHPPSAYEQQTGGRSQNGSGQNGHAGPGGYPAQPAGRDGRRCGIRRSPSRAVPSSPPQAPWLSRWVSPFKISPREPSSPCPCGHPAQENFVRLSTAYYPGS